MFCFVRAFYANVGPGRDCVRRDHSQQLREIVIPVALMLVGGFVLYNLPWKSFIPERFCQFLGECPAHLQLQIGVSVQLNPVSAEPELRDSAVDGNNALAHLPKDYATPVITNVECSSKTEGDFLRSRNADGIVSGPLSAVDARDAHAFNTTVQGYLTVDYGNIPDRSFDVDVTYGYGASVASDAYKYGIHVQIRDSIEPCSIVFLVPVSRADWTIRHGYLDKGAYLVSAKLNKGLSGSAAAAFNVR